jgi:hypothetical protein
MAKDLDLHKKQVRMLVSYFEKKVPTARGTMFFGTG